jgi:hypothetical protein
MQSIEQFNFLCSDLGDLLREKQNMLNTNDFEDVKSVRALQNKQDKLEHELGAIEKGINDLSMCAAQIFHS